MADNKMSVDNKVFKLPINVEANGTITKTLQTADTYVDKNIQIDIVTPDATYQVKDAGSVTATVSTTDTTYTSSTKTPYAITIAADAEASAVKVGVDNAGFAAATDEITVDGMSAEQNTKTIYVKQGHLVGSGNAAVEGNVGLTKVAAAPESGFYVKASADGSVSVDVAGWLPVDASADTDSEAFYTIKDASFANTATAASYSEQAGPVLTSGGYLYINEGYIGNTKISLADLVPDDANITDTNANLVYNTVKAYDKDGALIVGTMGDAALSAITANNASATIDTVSVAANGDVFKVSGSKAINGTTSVAIKTRGLAETSLSKSGTISGTANLDASLAKIGLNVTFDDNDVEVTPVIAKEDSTTAKSGAITTVAPAGGHYVAVSTAAIAASVLATPGVATEGYGTTSLHSATADSIKAGAAASGTYYVAIQEGSHSAVAGTPTVNKARAVVSSSTEATAGFEGDLVAGVLSSAPTGDYITIKATATPTAGSVRGTVTCTSTEGYVVAEEKTASISGTVNVDVTAAANKYIKIYDGSLL